MKKAILVSISFILLILTACQPTPDKETIFNKENIYTLAQKNTVISQEYIYDYEMIEMVETPSDKLMINIKAEVEIANENVFPVYSVKPVAFNRMLIEEMIEYFMPNASFYTNAFQITKEQLIEEMIAFSQSELYSEEESQEVKDEAEKYRQDIIGNYQKEIAEIPEQIERTYLKLNDIINPKTMNIVDADDNPVGVEFANDEDAVLSLINLNADSYTSSFKFDKGGYIQTESSLQQENQTVGDVTIRKSEAEASVKRIIDDLRIEGMSQVLIEKAIKYDRFCSKEISKGYYITYRREIEGLKTIDIGSSVVYDPDNVPAYIPPWRQEEINIFIDETGIQSFYWIGLSEIDEIVSENVELLSFDDIKERIRKQLIYKNIWVADIEDYSMSINVNNIILGISLIGTKDKIDTGMLAPAWYILYDESIPELDYKKGNALVINAIDGSIIEPRLDVYMLSDSQD